MFDNLTRRLSTTFAKLSGRTHLTADMLDDALSEIRIALLEADTALPVVKKILADIREKAIGEKIIDNVRPAEQIAKIVYDELVNILDGTENKSQITDHKSQIIMLVGLQGTGKTTTAGKLALHYKKLGKSVLLASTDIYRPSAREQLEMLAAQVGVDSLPIIADEKPINIAKRALSSQDVIIIDTAGRLHIDEQLMQELRELQSLLNPTDILLTADAMAGQESLNIAREFNNQLGITGLVMTRADGDARGGAVLSMKMETGAPVMWVGTGEKLADLELFYPDRVASRILGMGDVVSFVEKAQEHISEKDAENMMTKMFSGNFDLNDMLNQIKQIKKMGSIGGLLKLIPGIGAMAGALKDKATDSAINKQMAIIQSMTPRERARPEIIFAARKSRIAAGAGVSLREVEQMLKNYERMRAQIKQLSSFGSPTQLMEMMRNMPDANN
ncbi:MAG: signal recognition particle protein [Rickettsiales bacterium]|jgi:signal recognition particle subunit SRP54|nr:signal recognition particle protein [Rickettsiales bacterium]